MKRSGRDAVFFLAGLAAAGALALWLPGRVIVTVAPAPVALLQIPNRAQPEAAENASEEMAQAQHSIRAALPPVGAPLPGPSPSASQPSSSAAPLPAPGTPLDLAAGAPPPPAQASASGDMVLRYEEPLPHETGNSTAPDAPPAPADLPATPAPVPSGKPQIAIIFDDLGLNQKMTAAATALPPPLTLSFLPYTDNLPAQIAAGQRMGDAILLHMPMQPLGQDDPGPGALTEGLSDTEIRTRVTAALDAVPGAIGLNNHMGSRFTQDAAGLRPVFQILARRHLAFIDNRTTPASVAYAQARDMGLWVAARDVFLDDIITRPAIEAQLRRLETIARNRGQAIAIGHPYPATVETLKDWLLRLRADGFELVTIRPMLRQENNPNGFQMPSGAALYGGSDGQGWATGGNGSVSGGGIEPSGLLGTRQSGMERVGEQHGKNSPAQNPAGQNAPATSTRITTPEAPAAQPRP